jgi:transcription antitermination factor NusG
MNKSWYAVYTKPKCEKKVSASLTKKRIQNYCPINTVHKVDGNKKSKLVVEPLFPSFVFVYINEDEFNTVKLNNDVINFVFWLGRPVVIKDVEIENIKDFLETYTNVTVEKTDVSLNNMVRIVRKLPVNDVLGNVITMNSTIVKITLPTLGFVIVASANNESFEIQDVSYGVKHLIS